MIMLTIPIFGPVIQSLGFNMIWFGVIIVMVVMLGLITPPVGLSCYVISGIAKDVPLMTIFKGAAPYCAVMVIAIIIVTAKPDVALWLPRALGLM